MPSAVPGAGYRVPCRVLGAGGVGGGRENPPNLQCASEGLAWLSIRANQIFDISLLANLL